MKKLVIPFAIVVLGVAVTWWQPFSRHSPVNPDADSLDALGKARFLDADSLDALGKARFLDADSLDRPERGFVDAASRQPAAGSAGGNSRQPRRFGAIPRPVATGSATSEYFSAQWGGRPEKPARVEPGRFTRAANRTEEHQQILPTSAMAAYFDANTTNAPQPEQQIQPGSMLDEYFYPDAEPDGAASPPSGVSQQIQPGSMMSDYFNRRSQNDN